MVDSGVLAITIRMIVPMKAWAKMLQDTGFVADLIDHFPLTACERVMESLWMIG